MSEPSNATSLPAGTAGQPSTNMVNKTAKTGNNFFTEIDPLFPVVKDFLEIGDGIGHCGVRTLRFVYTACVTLFPFFPLYTER